MSKSIVAVMLTVLTACDPPRESDADAEPPVSGKTVAPAVPLDRASTEGRTAAAPGVATMPRVVPLTIRVEPLRGVGDTVEIEIALDRPLPPLARSRPTLHVGDIAVRRSRRAGGQLDRLVFLVDAAQFESMTDGALMVVRDVGFSSESMATPPVLDKSTLVTP